MLIEDLGIEPSRALQSLEGAILRQDPSLDLAVESKSEVSEERTSVVTAPIGLRDQHTAGGIKTFLVADVRGYTAFTQNRGDEAAASLATRFAELVRARVEDGGGSLAELRGDEALAVFDSVRQAIRVGIELQRASSAETIADPTWPLAVGIGLDAGEAVRVDGGYRGGARNVAARYPASPARREILVSRELAHLAGKLDGVKYVERGPIRLKDLTNRVDVINVRPELEDLAQDVAFRRALGPLPAEQSRPWKRPIPTRVCAHSRRPTSRTSSGARRSPSASSSGCARPASSPWSARAAAASRPWCGPAWCRHCARERCRAPSVGRSSRCSLAPIRSRSSRRRYQRDRSRRRAGLIEQLEEDERGLLRAAEADPVPNDDSELVLVLDQLEEVFTLVEERGARRSTSSPSSSVRWPIRTAGCGS